MSEQILSDCQAITALLPPSWEELAEKHTQLQTQYGNAKITNANDLLRLVLVHAAADLPLRQTVALVANSGGPDGSPMRLHKKMIRAKDYLHALVCGLVEMPTDLSPEKWSGYDISLVDAAGISRPGSVLLPGARRRSDGLDALDYTTRVRRVAAFRSQIHEGTVE